MTKATQTQTPTLTANGVEKGRPGKGRVLSLGQRARCYNTPAHKMTEDNIFRYTAKRVKGKPKPIEREWCKKCRAISRKASAIKRRLREAKEEQARQREVRAELRQALPKARKGAKAKAKAKAKAVKSPAARKAAATRKATSKRQRMAASQADAA